MEALQVYASDSDSEGEDAALPPPDELLRSFPFTGADLAISGGKVRNFPHVKGNYALHVYVPVALSAFARMKLRPSMKKAAVLFPDLLSMEDECVKAGDGQEIALCNEYHISLGRTVPIRVHQIDSIVQMLRRKFSSQKRYVIEFGIWEAFINDERTRSFLALEAVAASVTEIKKQVLLVDDVYKLHNLPPFYKNPRPHISLAWVSGDEMTRLTSLTEQLNKLIDKDGQPTLMQRWSSQVTKVECKVGQKVYSLWTSGAAGTST